MRRAAKTRKELTVVDRPGRLPYYTPFLARALWDLQAPQAGGLRGLIHYCNRDAVSWYGFTREILAYEISSAGVEVGPVTSEAYPRPARRPAWSVLDRFSL